MKEVSKEPPVPLGRFRKETAVAGFLLAGIA